MWNYAAATATTAERAVSQVASAHAIHPLHQQQAPTGDIARGGERGGERPFVPKYLFLLQCPCNRWNCWDRLRQPQIPRLSRLLLHLTLQRSTWLSLSPRPIMSMFSPHRQNFPKNWENSRRNLFSNGGHQISRSPSVKIVKMSTQKNLIGDRVVYLTCGILLRMRLACWDA